MFHAPILQQYQSYFDQLRCYFDVDNLYVLKKISIILFPFRHKKWSRSSASHNTASNAFPSHNGDASAPRNINQPDLYIPIMSFISYILLVGAIMGERKQFEPDALATLGAWRIFFWLSEMLVLRLGFYFFGLDSLSFLDALSYSGYKFVGIVLSIVASLFAGSYAYYPVLALSSLSMAIFMIRALRTAAIHSDDPGMRIKMDSHLRTRNWFLFLICIIQLPIMFWFSFGSAGKIFFVRSMMQGSEAPMQLGEGSM